MRQFMLVLLLALVASPLAAQRKRGDRSKISAEELAEFGTTSMLEVIPRVRPQFLMANGGTSQGMGEATFTGLQPKLLVYVGTQEQGDSTALRFYKANEVEEVRYFKPGNAMSPQSAGNAFVIQLIMKDLRKP